MVSTKQSFDTCRIDLNRLKEDLHKLSRIGRHEEDRGIYRMAFTQADMEGKAWLRERLETRGLQPTMDGAANVFGCLGKKGQQPSLLIGSHIDTVPCAGALDGTLGVIIGLECLRTLQDHGITTRCPIELVAFSDEEGHFGGMFGSQAFCGLITPETLHQSRNPEGTTLHDAMQHCGFDPMQALEARRDPKSLAAYLELHIEQGPVLDRTRHSVGLVEEITGLFRWNVRFLGEANHAGTTPMDMRNDAFMGLADFAHEIPRILEENGGERSRATIGKVEIIPGAPNTVPGTVEFSLDVRDTSPALLEELGLSIRKVLSAIARRRHLMFEFDVLSEIEPVQCDSTLVDLLEKQASKLELPYLRMPSGAAHDAQILARHVPTAMVFVPSKGGQSHSPAEWTDWDDIENGANLMLHTIINLVS